MQPRPAAAESQPRGKRTQRPQPGNCRHRIEQVYSMRTGLESQCNRMGSWKRNVRYRTVLWSCQGKGKRIVVRSIARRFRIGKVRPDCMGTPPSKSRNRRSST